MQPHDFFISIKSASRSSYYTQKREIRFDSYDEALTEKIRLKIFDGIECTAVRCGSSQDFDIVARAKFPEKYDEWLIEKQKLLEEKNEKELKSEQEAHLKEMAREKNRARYEKEMEIRRQQEGFMSARRELDNKVIAGDLTKDEYFAAVNELNMMRHLSAT